MSDLRAELYAAMWEAWASDVEKYARQLGLFGAVPSKAPKGAPAALANKTKFKPPTVKVDAAQQELFPEVEGTRMAKRKPFEEALHPRRHGEDLTGTVFGGGKFARKKPYQPSGLRQLTLEEQMTAPTAQNRHQASGESLKASIVRETPSEVATDLKGKLAARNARTKQAIDTITQHFGVNVSEDDAAQILAHAGLDDWDAPILAQDLAMKHKGAIPVRQLVLGTHHHAWLNDKKARLRDALEQAGDSKVVKFGKEGSHLSYVVHPSVQQGYVGKWQITTFGKDREGNESPFGHQVHDTREDAIAAAIGAHPKGHLYDEGDADYRIVDKRAAIESADGYVQRYCAMSEAWGDQPERYAQDAAPAKRPWLDVAEEIHQSAKANPLVHDDAPIKKGGKEFGSHWMDSDDFELMEVPVGKIDWHGGACAHLEKQGPNTLQKSRTPGPIVVDVNRRDVGYSDTHGMPKLIVLDGQHRLHEARQRGDTTIQAWVGDKARKHFEAVPERYAESEGQTKQPWEMTRNELANAINPWDRQSLQHARPLMAAMFPEYTADNDPWGIHRAVTRGDELPRIPMVDFTSRHRRLVQRARQDGHQVPEHVWAEVHGQQPDKMAGNQPVKPNVQSGYWQQPTHPGHIPAEQMLKMSDYYKFLEDQYKNEQGERTLSPRTHTADFSEFYRRHPVGTWRIDDQFRGIYGNDIEQLQELNPHDLELSEEDWTNPKINYEGRGDDARRYAEWMNQGHEPPPIHVVETDEGKLRVTNGHRRTAAAKMAGKPIKAWVSPSVPSGAYRFEGGPQKTGLTHQLAQLDADSLHPEEAAKFQDIRVNEIKRQKAGATRPEGWTPENKKFAIHAAMQEAWDGPERYSQRRRPMTRLEIPETVEGTARWYDKAGKLPQVSMPPNPMQNMHAHPHAMAGSGKGGQFAEKVDKCAAKHVPDSPGQMSLFESPTTKGTVPPSVTIPKQMVTITKPPQPMKEPSREIQAAPPKAVPAPPSSAPVWEAPEEPATIDTDLIARHQQGDKTAFPKILKQYTGLVRNMAGRFRRPGRDDEELRQIARLGLWHAANQHDAAKGAFHRYAAGTMAHLLSKEMGTQKTPGRVAQRPLPQVTPTEEGRDPLAELPAAGESGEQPVTEDIKELRTALQKMADAPQGLFDVGQRSKGSELTPQEQLARYSQLLMMRMGITHPKYNPDGREWSLDELGKHFGGVSHQRIAQLVQRGMEKVREYMEGMGYHREKFAQDTPAGAETPKQAAIREHQDLMGSVLDRDLTAEPQPRSHGFRVHSVHVGNDDFLKNALTSWGQKQGYVVTHAADTGSRGGYWVHMHQPNKQMVHVPTKPPRKSALQFKPVPARKDPGFLGAEHRHQQLGRYLAMYDAWNGGPEHYVLERYAEGAAPQVGPKIDTRGQEHKPQVGDSPKRVEQPQAPRTRPYAMPQGPKSDIMDMGAGVKTPTHASWDANRHHDQYKYHIGQLNDPVTGIHKNPSEFTAVDAAHARAAEHHYNQARQKLAAKKEAAPQAKPVTASQPVAPKLTAQPKTTAPQLTSVDVPGYESSRVKMKIGKGFSPDQHYEQYAEHLREMREHQLTEGEYRAHNVAGELHHAAAHAKHAAQKGVPLANHLKSIGYTDDRIKDVEQWNEINKLDPLFAANTQARPPVQNARTAPPQEEPVVAEAVDKPKAAQPQPSAPAQPTIRIPSEREPFIGRTKSGQEYHASKSGNLWQWRRPGGSWSVMPNDQAAQHEDAMRRGQLVNQPKAEQPKAAVTPAAPVTPTQPTHAAPTIDSPYVFYQGSPNETHFAKTPEGWKARQGQGNWTSIQATHGSKMDDLLQRGVFSQPAPKAAPAQPTEAAPQGQLFDKNPTPPDEHLDAAKDTLSILKNEKAVTSIAAKKAKQIAKQRFADMPEADTPEVHAAMVENLTAKIKSQLQQRVKSHLEAARKHHESIGTPQGDPVWDEIADHEYAVEHGGMPRSRLGKEEEKAAAQSDAAEQKLRSEFKPIGRQDLIPTFESRPKNKNDRVFQYAVTTDNKWHYRPQQRFREEPYPWKAMPEDQAKKMDAMRHLLATAGGHSGMNHPEGDPRQSEVLRKPAEKQGDTATQQESKSPMTPEDQASVFANAKPSAPIELTAEQNAALNERVSQILNDKRDRVREYNDAWRHFAHSASKSKSGFDVARLVSQARRAEEGDAIKGFDELVEFAKDNPSVVAPLLKARHGMTGAQQPSLSDAVLEALRDGGLMDEPDENDPEVVDEAMRSLGLHNLGSESQPEQSKSAQPEEEIPFAAAHHRDARRDLYTAMWGAWQRAL